MAGPTGPAFGWPDESIRAKSALLPIMPNEIDQAASRREFLQFVAASTALGYADKLAFAETLLPKSKLPDPMIWAPLDPANLIKFNSQEEAEASRRVFTLARKTAPGVGYHTRRCNRSVKVETARQCAVVQ